MTPAGKGGFAPRGPAAQAPGGQAPAEEASSPPEGAAVQVGSPRSQSAAGSRPPGQNATSHISAGMTASVEISEAHRQAQSACAPNGRRRIIDYILSPIARATSEAGRER